MAEFDVVIVDSAALDGQCGRRGRISGGDDGVLADGQVGEGVRPVGPGRGGADDVAGRVDQGDAGVGQGAVRGSYDALEAGAGIEVDLDAGDAGAGDLDGQRAGTVAVRVDGEGDRAGGELGEGELALLPGGPGGRRDPRARP